MIRSLLALAALLLPAAAFAAGPHVLLQTGAGAIVIELADKQAPITAGNFLKYVDQKKLDGTNFYRAVPSDKKKTMGFVQGGIHHSIVRALPPIPHEPTSKTGLKHLDGTISMAMTTPGSAMGDFFITVGALPSLDAHGKNPGFAAFGHVIKGMDVVKKILAAPTIANAGSGDMKGQFIAKPIPILSARRVP